MANQNGYGEFSLPFSVVILNAGAVTSTTTQSTATVDSALLPPQPTVSSAIYFNQSKILFVNWTFPSPNLNSNLTEINIKFVKYDPESSTLYPIDTLELGKFSLFDFYSNYSFLID